MLPAPLSEPLMPGPEGSGFCFLLFLSPSRFGGLSEGRVSEYAAPGSWLRLLFSLRTLHGAWGSGWGIGHLLSLR